MSDKILVVTSPDDVALDGIRILAINLTNEQGQFVSNALLQFDTTFVNVINYIWHTGDAMPWLLDKKVKSDLIIFNADSEDSTLTGYFAAHLNSYYFGNLKDLGQANNRAIYSSDQLLNLLEKIKDQYEPI